MQPMSVRERFHACMNFEPVDHLPMIEWAVWWDKTIDRWSSEGLSVTDRYELYRHFGLDMYHQLWLNPQDHECPQPESHGAGILTSTEDYERLLPHLFPSLMADVEELKRLGEQQARGEVVVWLTINGFFWFPRTLFGIENQLFAFYDHPELMHRMNQDLSEWILRTVKDVRKYCELDFVTFAEDMSYNHGPMISRELFDEFMLPYYRQVLPDIQNAGTFAIVDSDGDITEPAGWFRDAGVDGMLPLERQSGVDIDVMQSKYPDMRFIGHFDKMTMPEGEDAMRAEFERLLPAARRGGFLISVDHQTPPSVSLEQYETYLKLFREFAERVSLA